MAAFYVGQTDYITQLNILESRIILLPDLPTVPKYLYTDGNTTSWKDPLNAPTLVTPTLGVATATSINKLTITAPATSAVLTIADGKTLTASNSLTLTGTDASSVAFGSGGTVVYTSNKLSIHASTTSAELAGVSSDETGSGALVFGTSPAITTSLTTPSTSFALLNTTAATVNAFGAATTVSIGASSGTTTINNNLTISGNFIVNGTTTTINTTTVSVDDINITLGDTASPTDVSAVGGGITLKGATDKSIAWSAANGWTSSETFNIATGKTYKIAGTDVLSSTTLGSGVTGSSLTSVATIGTGTWQGTVIAGQYGGTGVANTGKTITLGGNLTTSGAFATTFTATATTSLTLPTSGTLATTTDTHYIGTTGVALNRSSANLALTGILSVTLPGSTSGSIQIIPIAVAGTGTVLTLPAVTGIVVTTGDTDTVTNTMLAGSIANAKLTNSSTTIGTTAIALGASSTTLAGLTSVTSTGFTGALTGNADTATTLATSRTIALTGDATASGSFNGSANYSRALTLATVNTNVGQFGSTTAIPVVTVNAKGLVTAISTVAISGSLTFTGDVTGTGSTGGSTALSISAGAVTNAMLAGSIANAKLTNSSTTVGTTAIALGASSTTLAGLTSVTSTSFTGALTGNASTVTNGVYTTDTGTVTNTMLAGSIANAKLTNSSITIGITPIALGATSTTLAGMTGITYSGSTSGTVQIVPAAVAGTGTVLTLPAVTGTLATLAGTETLTNKTIAAASNTISGLTNSNLSGTAGITNANLANSSVTVTAGTGMSGGGAVSLGGTVTLTNAGVLSVNGSTGTITGIATKADTLAQFAATTSAQLAGVISDETGSGALVFATSPTLVTPVLGIASATSVNKVTITAPATGSTLTIAEGKTLTASNTLTLTGTDLSSIAFGSGGTVVYTTNKLSAFSATTSAELAGVLSNETGYSTGALAVFSKSPSIDAPTITGHATIESVAVTGATGTGNLVFSISPTLTGTPLSTTAVAGTNTTQIATTAFVQTAVSNLVASAPATLDTLNELATALGNDANFSTTISTSIGLKAPIASPTFTGTVSGITKAMVGLGQVDNTSDIDKPVSTATTTAIGVETTRATTAEALLAPIASPTFTGTVSGITKAMVGLGQVTNTSDINKPVSTATTTAIGVETTRATTAEALLAPIASPTFTGTATIPTLNLTNALAVAYGGTGIATAPTNGQIDIGSTGVGFVRTTITAGSGITVTNAAGSITITSTSGGGSVTSVGQTFTGGLISVTDSPITSAGTLALTVAGTSGGIPYFSSASTWASSAALTQYGIIYGGGAGAAPVATAAGTTGQVLTATTGSAPGWSSLPSGSISVTGGDLTLSGNTGTAITNATLATVNSNIGTFNNVTVNAKGLVTAASNVSYLTSFTEADTLATVTGRGATTSTVSTFSGGGGDGLPALKITQTASASTFNWIASFMNSAINTAGRNVIMLVGQAGSSKNAAYLGFNWAAAGSNSNFLTLGLHSVDNVFNIFGSGNIMIGTTTDSGHKLNVAGTFNSTGAITGSNLSGSHSGTSSGTNTGDNPGVTSVSGTGTVSGLTLTGTVTGSGSLTLGGAIGTLNQNTTGTAGGLTGTPNITVGAITSGDVTTFRSGAPTTGYIYWGNTGTKYMGFDGSNIVASVSPSFSITGNATNVTGTVAVANGGTGQTTGYKLFDATFTSSINANTDRTAGMYGSYGSSATNGPTNSGILYNFMGGTGGAGDGGQFWQDYGSDNLYVRKRWGGSFNSWWAVLSPSNYNSYAPTLTGTGASGTWGINITGNAATATTAANYLPLAGGTLSGTVRINSQLQVGQNTSGTAYIDAYSGYAWFGRDSNSAGIRIDGSGNVHTTSALNAASTLSQGGNQVLHTANYNSYAPTLTGGSASGSWGISITGSSASCTGNAATASSAPANGGTATALNSSNYISQHGSDGSWNADFQNTPAGTTRYGGDVGANGTNGPGGSWWIQQNFRHTNSSNYWGVQTAWGWEDNPNKLATRSVSGGSFGNWVNYLNSSNYTSYSPSLTGSGASGTWGISITGNAATAPWSGITSKPSNIMYYQSFTLDANTMDSNSTGFTYSVNAPYTGPVVRISAGGSYDMWFNAPYSGGGNSLSFRTRNGDTGTINPWKAVLHDGNYTSYAPSLTGSGASGTWGINVTGTCGSISGFNNPTSSATGSTIVYRDGSGHITGVYGFFNYLNMSHGASGTTTDTVFYSSGDDYIRKNNATGFRASLNVPTRTGGDASGLWGINITGNSTSCSGNSATATNAAGSFSIPGSLTVGNSTSSDIYMTDTDEGTRRIHCNSNRIGFLNQSDGWGAYCDDSGNWFANNLSGTNTGDQTNISGNAGNTSSISNALGNGHTWTGTNYFVSNRNTSSDSPMLQAYSNDGGGAIMAFHRGGHYAINMGLDSDNIFRLRGWSSGFRWSSDTSGNFVTGGYVSAGTDVYTTQNYGYGHIGLYSSGIFQGMFAMGDAYKLSAGGGISNLYGATWSYPSAGGIAGNLQSHGMIVAINGGFGSCMSYNVTASQNVTAYSDERLKKNWEPLCDNFVEKLAEVKVGTYERTDQPVVQVGVSAQSLEKVIPEAVLTATDDMQTKHVAYGNAALASAVMLAKEIVELKQMMKQMQEEIAELKRGA